jgi:ubiquinone/menaquinone biosynthesis C-methylase UbiE
MIQVHEPVTTDVEIKRRVREFYDSVGWTQVAEGVYQNARYEDLRPVSREYIHRCHLRVGRHLPAAGRLLLDAGSGPIQYPEYLEYSRGYRRRVCLDISHVALSEARQRIGEHGLFVVGDIADLPFRPGVFDGVVSLHAVHHLPAEEHRRGFAEFVRVLLPSGRGVVVYSWGKRALLTRLTSPLIDLAFSLQHQYRRWRQQGRPQAEIVVRLKSAQTAGSATEVSGTFTHKFDYAWVRANLSSLPGLEVRVWRSVSTAFLRAFIHQQFLGRLWLHILFQMEELAPRAFGRWGQYPMILFRGSSLNEAPAGERQA